MKKVVGSTTTYYVGNWFEVTNTGAITKYYYFGGKRVAMKQGNNVTYLHGDHLGSTSVASNVSGALVARQTYFPYGAPRTSEGTLPTDYTFTGQKVDASSGLMYYNARYYDAALGWFTQPDSIIPRPYDPQTLNRYAYARGNPLKYVDPTGHDIIIVGGAGADESTGGKDPYEDPLYWEEWIREYAGWSEDEYRDWYGSWIKGDDNAKKELAQKSGVAIFKWNNVPLHEQLGPSWIAALFLQNQIDGWGLKDVTIIGHSKGGIVGATLMSWYEIGLPKGSVKNVVMIDPPQGLGSDILFGGMTSSDAGKAGVKAVFIPGQIACLGGGLPPCESRVKNDIVWHSTINDHENRSELAWGVFRVLNIEGDAHARSVR